MEDELDEITDRDRTRSIVKGALDVLLSVSLGTPGDCSLSMERLLEEFRDAVLPELCGYRVRARSRFVQKNR